MQRYTTHPPQHKSFRHEYYLRRISLQQPKALAMSSRQSARVCLYRPLECREILPDQHADRFAHPGQGLLHPGKDQTDQPFLINNSWYLVDLPGYGYARVSKSERREFSKLILDYVLQREQMHFLFVLVDSRLEPQKIDLDFITLLGEHGIPFGIVFTKCDKLSSNQTESNIARYRRTLLTEWEELPPMFRTSSEKRQGREAILDFIGNCLTAAAPNE